MCSVNMYNGKIGHKFAINFATNLFNTKEIVRLRKSVAKFVANNLQPISKCREIMFNGKLVANCDRLLILGQIYIMAKTGHQFVQQPGNTMF